MQDDPTYEAYVDEVHAKVVEALQVGLGGGVVGVWGVLGV